MIKRVAAEIQKMHEAAAQRVAGRRPHHGAGAVRIADSFRVVSRRDSPLDFSRSRCLRCTERSLRLEPSPGRTS